MCNHETRKQFVPLMALASGEVEIYIFIFLKIQQKFYIDTSIPQKKYCG